MYPSSPAPDPSGGNDDGEGDDVIVWSGNIQYLINISTIGALCCVFIFFFLKLRSDHRQIPGPSALLSKLLAVWHATGIEIARHCGADAAQFLIIEGGSCAVLIGIAVVALLVLLPLNLYMGNAIITDQFSRTIISHIDKGSPLLWIHFISVLVIVILAHFGISSIQGRLKVTRFRDGFGNPSDPTSSLTAIFTLMVQGIPKNIGCSPSPLKTYFRNKYPGRIFKVIVPMDLCALNDLIAELVHVRDEISWLVARIDSSLLPNEQPEQDHNQNHTHFYQKLLAHLIDVWRKSKTTWVEVERKLGFTDEIRLSRLQQLRGKLEAGISSFKQGHVPGAGVAFVVFKDVDTANKALQDFKREKMKRMGTFFSVTELQMGRNQWKVGRAPLATDIYWNHLGLTKVSLKLRRVCVNTCLVLLLLFFSSPLSVISAVKSAGQIISIEAMDSAQSWVTWVQSSSWIGTLIFQFLPNVIVFVSMYIVVPSALSYLSKFERHITVSGEQRAALLKMVCFFLVNLIILRALVESSLEGLILRMGKCYLDGEECKRFEQYLNWSFLSKSCLSSLAFLIASTFLGISFDLLAPVPWIKKKIQKFRKNDMLHLVPEQTEDTAFGEEGMMDYTRNPLLQEEPTFQNGFSHNQDMSVYPINGASPLPKQTFDFAQYYAFNLTVFALTMIYSSFAPLVVPVGAIYFGYRYVVDKYNFLFVYRVRGYPSGNDGRLMDTVLFIMRFSVDLFLLSMILFFSVQGDSAKLQAIFTLGLLIMYKLLPTNDDNSQPTVFEGMQAFMHRIKEEDRSYRLENLCDFNEEDHSEKFPSGSTTDDDHQQEVVTMDVGVFCEGESTVGNVDVTAVGLLVKEDDPVRSEENSMIRNLHVNYKEDCKMKNKSEELFTPKPVMFSNKNQQVGKKSEKQTSVYAKNQSIPRSRIRNFKNNGAAILNQENQAIKKQKLEGGKSKQIPNLKAPPALPHKSKLGNCNSSSSVQQNNKSSNVERKVYVREAASSAQMQPFISTAEMMMKFQSSTKEICTNKSIYSKPKLTLTRPKELELVTSQRVRLVKMKSTADLEEEEMAKIPKFKARPLNKKILEAPNVVVQRSAPKPTEFQEFHLETMTRANQNSEAAAPTTSTDVPRQQQWKPNFTEPKTPLLYTSIRARPPTLKSSMEMEKEELEKFPKFKARQLNKKIFESKGELGVFCNFKKQITIPQEFNFATNERFPPPPPPYAVTDLFDKLSLNSLEQFHGDNESSLQRITTPIPFHLHTDERGAEKERRLLEELINKQLEEERCRIPKANPYPYTTDFPLLPPKPEPKPCTKPEPFQMESLIRHEKEVQRDIEHRQRRDAEEAEMRLFKAQPFQKEDLIPVHEKVRKPLTEVQEFNLCADQRATKRAEFDNRIKEKELLYKRYREESEATAMMEEEKALKQMRRTMVPQARPVPSFRHPFCPHKSSKETTRAKSPKLLVPQRKQRRKMLNVIAASSPAFSMR